jgi:hypothetical protein
MQAAEQQRSLSVMPGKEVPCVTAYRNGPLDGTLRRKRSFIPCQGGTTMQRHRALVLDAASLREELAAIENQIQLNPKDIDLIDRQLTYARKIREIEHRENGYVTARV